jgi:hypothetical protein
MFMTFAHARSSNSPTMERAQADVTDLDDEMFISPSLVPAGPA